MEKAFNEEQRNYRKFEILIPKDQADLMESAINDEEGDLAEELKERIESNLQDMINQYLSISDPNRVETVQIILREVDMCSFKITSDM